MNVIDKYKNWTCDQINKDLNSKRSQFSILICNLSYCNNVGNIIRTGCAFNCQEIIIFGRRKYNRKAAVGSYRYMNFRFTNSHEYLMNEIVKGRPLIAIENNVGGAKDISTYQWKPHSILAFGSESSGLTAELLYDADDIVEIRQKGSVRSLNVASAGAIALYECSKQLGI